VILKNKPRRSSHLWDHHVVGRPLDPERFRSEPFVELRDASAAFGSRTALSATTLDLHGGTSIALVGANGSGKTTLLRLIAGLLSPASGAVLHGEGIRFAYVAQHQHQHRFMPLTAGEVLDMSRYGHLGLLGRFRSEDRAAVQAAATRLQVAELRDHTFSELSGGQRQRVLIASAVASQAHVLLLDEPVTGLDLPSQRRIMEVVAGERADGRLVVLSTHDLDEARQCDVVVLLAGRVVAHGSPSEVLVAANLRTAFGSHVVDDHGRPQVIDDHGHGSHGDDDHDHGGCAD
jgi:ABC-type Mn2+/Zn2+ transport system ATPase subunit